MNQVLLTVFYLSLWAIVIFCIYVPFVWLTEHWNRIGQGLAFLALCAAKIALVYVWFVTGPDWLYLPGFLMLLPEATCIFHFRLIPAQHFLPACACTVPMNAVLVLASVTVWKAIRAFREGLNDTPAIGD